MVPRQDCRERAGLHAQQRSLAAVRGGRALQRAAPSLPPRPFGAGGGAGAGGGGGAGGGAGGSRRAGHDRRKPLMCAMLHTLEEKVTPGHTALLVVDVQRDFCASDGAFGGLGRDLSRVQEMLPALERLVESARRADVTVIFLRYAQTPATESE